MPKNSSSTWKDLLSILILFHGNFQGNMMIKHRIFRASPALPVSICTTLAVASSAPVTTWALLVSSRLGKDAKGFEW